MVCQRMPSADGTEARISMAGAPPPLPSQTALPSWSPFHSIRLLVWNFPAPVILGPGFNSFLPIVVPGRLEPNRAGPSPPNRLVPDGWRLKLGWGGVSKQSLAETATGNPRDSGVLISSKGLSGLYPKPFQKARGGLCEVCVLGRGKRRKKCGAETGEWRKSDLMPPVTWNCSPFIPYLGTDIQGLDLNHHDREAKRSRGFCKRP